MAHKTLIDGVGYSVTGGKTLVDGTGYKVTGGKTLVNGSAYVIKFNNYDPVFGKNSWAQIRDACEKNKVPETWYVGDQNIMTVGDDVYIIDIIGKNHDIYVESGTVPITFQFHSAYSSTNTSTMHTSSTNTCGWNNSNMRTSILPTILALMEDDVKNGVRKVCKYTATSGYNSSTVMTEDSLFLLSEVEVTGTNGAYSHSGEGTWYEYYQVSGRTSKELGPDSLTTSSNADWWLRSPARNISSAFVCVCSGSIAGVQANVGKTIAPAFCF